MQTTYIQKNDNVAQAKGLSAISVEDHSMRADCLQRKSDLANGAVQRMDEEEEEPVQGKSIQREAIPEELEENV